MPRKGAQMKRPVTLLTLIFWTGALCAQTFDTEFNPGDEQGETHRITSDDDIFNSPAWGAPDPFRDLSRYRFASVRYRERGLDGRHLKTYIGGADLSDNISPYPDYTLISLLWRTSLERNYTPAMVAGNVTSDIGYADHYSLRAVRPEGTFVSVRASDRYSRVGADIRQNGYLGGGWSHSFSFTGQVGGDGHIPGVRGDEAGGTLSVSKELSGKQVLTLFAAGSVSRRGIRTAAVKEAFELTGDKLYNPSWGWQDGKIRNSRQGNVRQLFTAASFETPLGKGRRLTASAAFSRSHNGRTRLAWYDAHSPMPDYYRMMPSYFPDWSASGIIADAWRAGDTSVTQVDWYSLYYNNTLSQDGHATYIIEEQVELTSGFHFSAAVDRELAKGFDISCGIRLRCDGSRFFKLADDMLEASYVLNTDQYVTGDDGDYRTGPRNENDLRNPARRVYEGDRFGYDYTIARWKPSVFGIVRRDWPDYGLNVSASLTCTAMRRKGHYEKELFAGAASFGKSATAAFTTYSIGASAYWNVSVRHKLSISALASAEPPFAADIFISPEQNNHMISSPEPAGIYGAEISWVFAGKNIDLRVTGFLNSTIGETQIRQYYDDLSSTFANMTVRGIDKLCCGVEAGIEARITRRLSLTAGVSAGDFRYNSEPTAAVFADSDNSVISQGIVCYMSGLKLGPPQTVAAVAVTYSDRRWRASISGEYMGNRHVSVNPLYHSSRVAGINAAPEIMEQFTSQERLPDAFVLGISLSKSFEVGKGYLRVGGTVRNLLSSDIIHSGYEQMRILRSGSGVNRTLVPFPSKYMYSYPLTWSVTVSYRL